MYCGPFQSPYFHLGVIVYPHLPLHVFEIISRYHTLAKRLPEVVGLLGVRDEPSFALDSPRAVASGDSATRFLDDAFAADKVSLVPASLIIPSSSKAVTKESSFLTEIIIATYLAAIEENFPFRDKTSSELDSSKIETCDEKYEFIFYYFYFLFLIRIFIKRGCLVS